jgi:hypothetical protein
VAGSTGNIFPTVGATVDRAGSTLWTTPENVVSDNGSNATSTVPTDYLVTSGYGFAIPATCRILGVTVRVEMTETGSGSSSYIPQLHSDTTPTLIGSAKSAVTVTNGPAVSSNGGVADLWSATLTPAVVNAAGFGVSIWSTDTINGLQCDYITIAIEYGEEAPWLTGQETFRKRRNTTNRRWLSGDALLSFDVAAETSDDRALEEPFVTRVIRSRRALSIGWMDALTAQVQAPAVPPVAAWLVVQTPRRRETERRLLVADVTPIERYTPPSIAWSDPPKVIRVDFVRKLQVLAPQVELPPPAAPPGAEGFPAWTARRLPPTFQDRRALRIPEHNVYPETPKPEPNLCARIPTGFHRRRDTERRLLTVKLDQYTATPAEEASDDRALAAPFVTRTTRSRRLLKSPELLSVDAAEPPGPSPANLPAATLTKAKRRKSRQGLFLSSGETVEARVQAQYPSYAVPHPKKRKSTKRRLLRLPHPPSTPATPAVPAQPVTAWQAPKQHRIERERTLQKAAPQVTHPATPVVSAQPVSAWIQPPQHFKAQERKSLGLPVAAFYAPFVAPAQPEAAFRAPRKFRKDQKRKLQPAAPQITYPRTLVADVAARPVRALKRNDTKRKLRTAEHAPLYTQTPVPFQEPTSWKLAEGFRRHGWRRLRSVLELDTHPESPEQVKPTYKRTHKMPKPNRTLTVKRADRTLKVEKPERTE